MDTIDYKTLFDQSSALIVVMDTSFTIVAASDAFLESTKTLRENIIGRDAFDVFPDNPNDITVDGENRIRASLNRVLKNKAADSLAVVKYDIPRPESEGGGYELKYWRPCHTPILDADHNVKYIVQRVIDVTENESLIARLEAKKKALKQIGDSEKRYNIMLLRSPFAFAVLKGKDMVITLANDSIKEMWGKGTDMEGKAIWEVLPELKDSAFPSLLDSVYTTGTPFYGDELLAPVMRQGKLENLYFNFIYQPYLEADETISGVTIIAYEVTGQVEVKKALAAQREVELNALKMVEESNARYYMMLMQSPFAFCIMKGKDMVVTLANGLIKEFWGKGQDVEGKTLLQILPELIDQPFPDMIDRVFTTGIPVSANEILARLKHNDKLEDRYFNIVYQPYHEADESISGVISIAYEVTEMVLARKSLQESEKKFRQLVDSMPQKITNADADGHAHFFNQQWLDETGYTLDQLINGWDKAIHPDDLQHTVDSWNKAVRSGTIFEVECRIINKGEYKWNLSRAVPIKDENGKTTMWVGSTTVIHQQKELEAGLEKAVEERTKELGRANKELAFQSDEKEKRSEELVIANKELAFQNDEKGKRAEELILANQELQAFTYVSSHDLQEPLRKIQTFAELILDEERENLSDKGKGYFQRMQTTAQRMQTLINDLLAYSHTNATERKFESTDLNEIIEEVKNELKETILQKHAIIEARELCLAHIIVFQFHQLVYNLIGNALKFSKPDHPPHIIIKSRIVEGSKLNDPKLSPEKNYCHISITDNGIGFEPEFQDKIFEVFQRLHGQEEYQGTGIGLAIVKKIVENHHGIITASSQLNKGATFNIYIPAN